MLERFESRLKLTKAISFVAKAAGFSVAMFLGPVAALTYTTLATYCFTEGISLKSIIKKTFNPVISPSTRNNREISDSSTFANLDLEGYKFRRLLFPGIVPSMRNNVHLLDNYNPSGTATLQTGSILVRKLGYEGHHRTKRFILRLINTFFDITYKSSIKLPGYFELHPEGALESQRSALLELGRELNDLGGEFYSFGESLFKDAWQKETEFWSGTVDKLKDFFTFSTVLSQRQAASGLEAIDEYRKEMGYYTRMSTSGKLEWDVARDLQAAISNQLGRWISLREMGTIFRGREVLGMPIDDSFFIRRIQGVEQKFRKDSIGDLLFWIENPISWNHDGIDYTVQLSGNNYDLAKHSLLLYNDHVYNSKNMYIVDESAPNIKSLKIINTLLLGYSKHPRINRNFAKKGIAFRPLFKHLGAYNWRVCRGENIEFSEKQVKHLLFEAREDALQLFAPREFQTLINQIKDLHPHWWLTIFGIGKTDTYIMKDMIYYYDTYEPRMTNYYKLAIMNPGLVNQYSNNKYYPGFLAMSGQPSDPFLKREQARILLRHWGGRNPRDGIKIPTDSLGYPLVSITAHHYEYAVINPLNYYDCRISALVPFLTSEHNPSGEPHTIKWYNRFKLSKEAIAEGRIPVPMWWDKNIRLDYIRELKTNGLKNYIKLIRDPP